MDKDELKTVVEANTSPTTYELAARLEVSISTALNHLMKQIGMVKKLDKWLPHKLNEHQMTSKVMLFFTVMTYKSKLFLHHVVI